MSKKLYHCTRCHYSFLAAGRPQQCIDCGKYAVREATDSEAWDWVRYAMEERAVNVGEALAYVEKLAG